MSQANIKNTAIFVTVLSVYLGLALIGAPPHILAQAVNSQNSSEKSVEINRKPLEDFGQEFFNLYHQGKIDFDQTFLVKINAFANADGTVSNANVTNKAGDAEMTNLATSFAAATFQTGVFSVLSSISSKSNQPIKFDLTITQDAENLTLLLTAESERATQVASGFNLLAGVSKQQRQDKIEGKLLNYFQANAEGNKVLLKWSAPKEIAQRFILDALRSVEIKARKSSESSINLKSSQTTSPATLPRGSLDKILPTEANTK